MARASESSAKSGQAAVRTTPDPGAEKPKGLPAEKETVGGINHNSVGRHVIRSNASQRALDARNQLKKLNKAGLKDMTDEKLSQLSRTLGLQVRGTGASGEVTRGDYVTALEGRLPIPVKGAGK